MSKQELSKKEAEKPLPSSLVPNFVVESPLLFQRRGCQELLNSFFAMNEWQHELTKDREVVFKFTAVNNSFQ